MPSKRSIEKRMVTLTLTSAATSNGVSLFKGNPALGTGTSVPLTVKGVRWNICVNYQSANGAVGWAIVVMRQGITAWPLLDAGNSGAKEFYPLSDSDVLAGGVVYTKSTDTTPICLEGEVRTARKLKPGDNFAFVYNNSAGGAEIRGLVQYFELH